MLNNSSRTINPCFSLRKVALCVALTIALCCLSLQDAKAAVPFLSAAEAADAPAPADSTFLVESFRQLPTDVSAFIDAVRDLNDEACALLKVVAPADFAFSSPLGIVERRDKVGEIWLFMPKGTKSITLKHPQWGALRDYAFGTKLESRMTYEMRLRLPQAAVVEKHDTVVYTQTIVDTVTVAPPRRVVPLHLYTLLTASMHTDGPSWGAMIAVMSRHGGYVHASTNLRSGKKTIGACNREGYRDGATAKPYYSGSTHTSEYAVTVGLIHRINANFNVFEGAGYAKQTTAWQLAKSEGGGWLRNDGLTHKGVAAEIGVLFTKGRLSVSASALTIGGSQWQGCVGIGIRIGKNSVITKPAKR